MSGGGVSGKVVILLPVQRFRVSLAEPEHHKDDIVPFQGSDVAGKERLFGQHTLHRGDGHCGAGGGRGLNMEMEIKLTRHGRIRREEI